MDECYIGTILLWTASFVPRGWALCDGSLLNITQNPALFAILGTRYGGDGRTTFQLPDLRNRVPMGLASVTQAPGATGAASHPVVITGTAAGMLSANQLPAVNGKVSLQIPANNAPTAANITDTPGPAVVQDKGTGSNFGAKIYTSDAANANLKPFDAAVTVPATAQQPLTLPVAVSGTMNTIQPSLTVSFIICVQGLFPPRPD
ncbi:phage tail protein [Paracidovorax konjaci]|uniref:Microcystin-dependent protein n=1 Tax=Paracidovorax konjaci TaxID=32040 RepID=A0A1I1VFM0_9BURK|nr:tail fiber protein [Paracidovorax konjaci]SFD81669.1 Microcystin-dependent protein [Paracidovorax konjaci]